MLVHGIWICPVKHTHTNTHTHTPTHTHTDAHTHTHTHTHTPALHVFAASRNRQTICRAPTIPSSTSRCQKRGALPGSTWWWYIHHVLSSYIHRVQRSHSLANISGEISLTVFLSIYLPLFVSLTSTCTWHMLSSVPQRLFIMLCMYLSSMTDIMWLQALPPCWKTFSVYYCFVTQFPAGLWKKKYMDKHLYSNKKKKILKCNFWFTTEVCKR